MAAIAAGRDVEWRFVVFLQIANYAMLRRHVGAGRAGTLAADIVAGLKQSAHDAKAWVAGRDLIHIEITGFARADLDQMLNSFRTLLAEPLAFDVERHLVEFHIGAAAAVSDSCDEVRLIEEAEQALVEARTERRPIIRDVARASLAHDPIALARDLSAGIAGGELFLQYQPKLHVRRQEIAGVEALVRWRHAVRGLVMPNDFIPLAEQSRDIVELTLWAIRQVIADQRRMAAHGYDIPVFINIAGVLLTDTEFVRQACALIQGSGTKIGFEITETSVIRDPQSAIAHLKLLADIGVTIAIDDYGAGLSSLAYLKQLPARELKIDKMFITHLTSSNRDPLIVRSTIDLAHALEMEVVAEGVETPASLALLSVMGCDVVQGYLISRPVCLDSLITYLKGRSADRGLGEQSSYVAQFRQGFRRTA